MEDLGLLRLKEISKRSGLSTTILRKLIKNKSLKATLYGGNYYVREEDYDEFVFNVRCKIKGHDPVKVKKIAEYLMKIENEQRFNIMNEVNSLLQNEIFEIVPEMKENIDTVNEAVKQAGIKNI